MKKDTSKTTVLIISMGFLTIGILFSLEWALFESLAIGILGIISNTLSKKIDRIWMGFASLLNYIISPVVLGIVFYIILCPIALVSRFFVKNSSIVLEDQNTFFITINKEFTEKSFEKPW
jgi:hypothetical protein